MASAVETEVIAFGGASLAAHWNKGEALTAIKRQAWDAVVLQDQSTRPLRAPKSMQQYGRLFVQAVQAAGARAWLYVTWARETDPESQEAITAAYEALARESGASLVPVGPAWQRLRQLGGTPALYDADKSHPSYAGSYLSACVFCACLFGKQPQGVESNAGKLQNEDAMLIHRIAWQVASESHH